MQRLMLSLAAVMSLVALSVLILGVFLTEFKAQYEERDLGVGKTSRRESIGLGISHGLITIAGYSYRPGVAYQKYPGLNAYVLSPILEWPPHLFRDLSSFGMIDRPSRTGIRRGIWFPIWCPAAPLLIAPILWLRSRRRSTRLSAFPVIEIARQI